MVNGLNASMARHIEFRAYKTGEYLVRKILRGVAMQAFYSSLSVCIQNFPMYTEDWTDGRAAGKRRWK